MQHTEVMIKDIADSKRIDHYVYPEGPLQKGREENEVRKHDGISNITSAFDLFY